MGTVMTMGATFFLLPSLWPEPCPSLPASSWPRVIKALITRGFELQDLGAKKKKQSWYPCLLHSKK